MVVSEWQSVSHGDTPITRWQNKIRHLRHFLKGWAKNRVINTKNTKTKRLLSIIDVLDIKAESNPLGSLDKKTLRDDNNKLNSLRRDEEAKWAQHAKVKHFQEGGNNTKYFH
jgi:hypothetical protein